MIRAVALLLTVLTGFSGLVYEVTWQKYLATLLGSHSEATAAVLGLFLGGLALGYSLFGRLTRALVARAQARRTSARLLSVYGAVEAGIGALALLFPLAFAGVQALSLRIPHASAGSGFALDVALAALLVLPPAVLMGGTIPLLTQALARSLEDATRFHALVYAFNTAGAFAGALAAGYWLLPWLGLDGVLVAMGALNLAAGALFLALGARHAPLGEPAPPGAPDAGAAAPVKVAGFARFAAAALLAGFAMMTLQNVLIRLGGLALGSSQFTFSMVVAVFVLCIALGAFTVSALPRIPALLLPASLWLLLGLLTALYAAADTAPYWAHALRALHGDEAADFAPFQLRVFTGVLVVLALPVALSGAVLPLMFHALRGQVGGLGDVAGRLYSWNTLGSLLGALVGGYALLFWLDLHQTFRIALAAIAVAAALMTFTSSPARPLAAVLALVLALAAIAGLPAWQPEQLASGLFRKRSELPYTFDGPRVFFENVRRGEVLFYDDDPIASIAVKRYQADDGRENLAIVSNGKSDSTIPGDTVTTILLALIPAWISREPARSLVVGYGTGVTAGELATLAESREVIVAEISPGVIEAAPHFDFGNQNASLNPKIHVVQGDAYRALLRSEGPFDLIVSEPSNPWVTGVEMLYSREFLTAARERLTPGGVHAQWFHRYETDDETIALVLRTYQSVFEHASVWFTLGPDLLLIGVKDPGQALALARLAERFERPDFRAGFARAGVASFAALLAHELLPVDVLAEARLEGPLHTLLHPILSDRAARAFFAGRTGHLPVTAQPGPAAVGMRNSLLRRHAEANGGALDESERASVAEESCRDLSRTCANWLARWIVDTPQSAERRELRASLAGKPLLAQRLRLADVERLLWLYDGGAPQAPLAKLTPANVLLATRLYADLYHHAAPFSPRALAQLWQRCASEPGDSPSCAEAREQALAAFGDLGF